MGNVQEIPSLNTTNAEKVSLLLDILSTKKKQFEEGITEYALISQLKSPPYQLFNEDALRDSLALFNTHFVLFHALYLLRERWRKSSFGELEIHTTRIVLKPFSDLSHHTSSNHLNPMERVDPLAEYYLNWQNLVSTDETDVEALLSSFWQRMTGATLTHDTSENIAKYKQLLKFPDAQPMSFSLLKRHYRKQLARVHPDKGGSHEDAQSVISAYQGLLRYYGL